MVGPDNEVAERGSKTVLSPPLIALGCVAGVVAVAMSTTALTGCDAESCQQIQRDYEEAISGEAELADLSDDGPPHLAMAMRLDLVDELTSDIIDAAIGDAISTSGSFRISGQSIDYAVQATEADLNLAASGACSGCLDVSGDIDGDLDVELPGVGSQSVPLSGTVDWTVPLDAGMDGGDMALLFDTEQAVQMGAPAITGQIDDLPDTWTDQVVSAITDELADEIASRVDPIPLVTYEVPELGSSGVEVTPSLFGFDETSNSVVLGLRTNLEVSTETYSDREYVEAMSLGDGQNASLAIQPRLVAAGARLAMREGHIPRRYSTGGTADSDGVASAVFDDFDAGVHRTVPDAVGTRLMFRAFNFRGALMCWTMRGEIRNRFQVTDGELRVELEDVTIQGPGSIVEGANWSSSRFVEYSEQLFSTSLDDTPLSSSEYGVDLRSEAIGTEAGMVVLKGVGSPQ